MIGYKKRLAGLFLTGLMAEILFIPYGDGSNGKTTEHETYQAILGDYAQAADASLLLARKETSGPTPEIVALKNKRVIVINETREGARLNEARVKYLTGNDTICARGLHQDPINFRPTHKVVMRTNHKPIIRGVDKGIWRRIHLIPHMVTIEDSEAEDHYRENKLVPEHAGILNWMIEGLQIYFAEGLKPPAAVTEATDAYREEMDLVAQWLADRCDLSDPKAETKLKKLADDFNAWAKDDMSRPIESQAFSARLTKLKLEKAGPAHRPVFLGVKLKEPTFAST